jgi:hypothetical protein
VAHHGRRRDHRDRRTARRLMPLAVVGLGLAQLGVVSAGSLAATAVAAPAVTSTDDGSARSPDGESGESVPCAKTVKACARLSTQEVWITDGAGKLLRGPIHMNHGEEDNPTPTGTFHVQRKDRYHVSQEQKGSKMPYAVFFDGEGRAFHQGDPSRESVGCIRMAEKDAAWVFEHLEVGDSVQIVK